MDPNDLLAFLTANDPAAAAQAQAMARQARRDQGLGQLSAIIGGPFKGAAQTFGQDADQGQQLLNTGALERQREKLARDKMLVYAPDADALEADRAAKRDLQRQGLALQRERLLRPPTPKPVDTSKRYLGAYLTPAEADLPDAQRNDLMNNLAGPGAEWIDQMAELSALLDVAGDAPTPNQLSDIHRLIAAGLTKQNKVAGLGALSGPDLDLLKKAGGSVGDLTNFLGQATGLRDLKRSVRSAAERGAKDIQIRTGGYGSKPIPGEKLDFSTFDTRAAEYRKKWAGGGSATASPPGGVTMTLGGKTKVVPPDQVEFWRSKGATEVK